MKILKGFQKNNGVSKISQIFCKALEGEILDIVVDFCLYDEKNNEICLSNKTNLKKYYYDFAVIYKDKKKIIEFNGDFWHANPQMYSESYIHGVTKKTAKEI